MRWFFLLFFFACCGLSSQSILQIDLTLEEINCEWDSINTTELELIDTRGNQKVISKDFYGCRYDLILDSLEGDFRVQLKREGFESKEKEIQLFAFNSIIIPLAFYLDKPSPTQEDILDETNSVLEVKKKNKLIRVDAGKTIVGVEENPILSNGSIWEAIEKLPGIIVDPSGAVLINGKSAQIWIDGLPTGLSGQDLTNFLNGLPAESVKEIEIISSPGAKYDSDTQGGIINIITGKSKLRGTNATINSTYTRNEYNKINHSIRIGSRYGFYNSNLISGFGYFEGEDDKRSNFNFENSNAGLSQSQLTEKLNRNFFLRWDNQFKISRKTKLGIKYNFNIESGDPYTSGGTSFSPNTSNDFESQNRLKTSNTRNEIGLDFGHKFSRNFNTSSRINFSNFRNNNTNLSQEVLQSQTLFNNIRLEQDINNFLIGQDFEIKTNVWDLSFNAGVQADFVNVKSNGLYDINSTDVSTFSQPKYDSNLSLFFDYKESNYAFYFESRKSLDKWELGLGIRGENLSLDSRLTNTGQIIQEQERFRLFPTFDAVYDIGNELKWNFSYRRKINRASYSDLDPNLNGVFNSVNQETGNPRLRPSLVHKIETRIGFMEYLGITLGYDYSEKPFIYVLESDESFNINRSKRNFDDAHTFYGNFSLPIPLGVFTKGLSYLQDLPSPSEMSLIYLQGGLIYNHFNGADEFVLKNRPLPYLGVYSQILLPLDLRMNLFYLRFGPGTYEAYYLNKPNQGLNLSFNRKFFKEKLKVNLLVQDIFNSKSYNVSVFDDQLEVNLKQKEDTRFVRLGLTYNFGKLQLSNNGKDGLNTSEIPNNENPLESELLK